MSNQNTGQEEPPVPNYPNADEQLMNPTQLNPQQHFQTAAPAFRRATQGDVGTVWPQGHPNNPNNQGQNTMEQPQNQNNSDTAAGPPIMHQQQFLLQQHFHYAAPAFRRATQGAVDRPFIPPPFSNRTNQSPEPPPPPQNEPSDPR